MTCHTCARRERFTYFGGLLVLDFCKDSGAVLSIDCPLGVIDDYPATCVRYWASGRGAVA